jgi:hypothetical protein
LTPNPITQAEDAIIRPLREAGGTIMYITNELARQGYKRHRQVVYEYVVEQGISAPKHLIEEQRRESARQSFLRHRAATEGNSGMTPEQATEEFGRRWQEHHPGKLYRNAPRGMLADRVNRKMEVACSAGGYMTLGGVAVYG